MIVEHQVVRLINDINPQLKNGRYKEAIDMDIEDIREKFPDGRYNSAIDEMIKYYKSIGTYK